MNYKKLIKDNAGDFKDESTLEEFIDSYLLDNKEISELDDNLHEFADGEVPIYYNDIVKEWRDCGECHGQAGDEGLIEGETDAYKIMQVDLYAYYYQEISQDFNTLVDLIESEE